jgi:putative Holliday junction resolvase
LRILALDIGEKRTGIAVSDVSEVIASPLVVLQTQEVLDMAKPFKRLLDDYEVDLLLVGLPKTLSGGLSEQSSSIVDLANTISHITGIKLEYFDERLSSKEAKKVLREMGMSEKEMRGNLDKYAAAIFLQTYLDLKKGTLKKDALRKSTS